MRSIKSLSKTKLKKMTTVGALLAASLIGAGAMNTAHADWSATTKADAWFFCEANCAAGGLGPVGHGTIAQNPKIGAWQRTVAIKCKYNSVPSRIYLVSVKDKNWAGSWQMNSVQLTQGVNDSGFPFC